MSSSALALSPRLRSSVPTLAGWGRLAVPGREVLAEDLERATSGAVLSRGLGRSYGDSSLPARPEDKVVGTRLANRILAWDPETGVIRVEAGLCLAELNRLFMPRGFFTPVTPGTKFVTVGGMVASDVHGKNHHRNGCFGAHVRSLRLRVASDDVVDCSPDREPELFFATIGGMGLTGHILEVEFQLARIASSWILLESERVPDVETYVHALGEAAPKWPMTMGWIDCLNKGRHLGRGILMVGRWAEPGEAPAAAPKVKGSVTFPIELPNWALNRLTGAAFNALYYWKHVRRRFRGVIPFEPFFYPLDAILHWNRAYGSRGFTQYQCVLPRAAGPAPVREFMVLLTKLGAASPLCVIKDCGDEGKGLLSFPMPGTSVAIDMAVSPDIQRIVDRLNEFVIAAGGRIYLTKDRFTRPEHFRKMEPRLERFLDVRRRFDPTGRLRSAQSVRLFGDPA